MRPKTFLPLNDGSIISVDDLVGVSAGESGNILFTFSEGAVITYSTGDMTLEQVRELVQLARFARRPGQV